MDISELEPAFQEKCRKALAEVQAQSLSATNNWAHVDKAQVHADWDNLYKQLTTHIHNSTTHDSAVQELIAQHYQIACRFYTPGKEAYIGMALFYEENADMKQFHNQYHPQMVEFLSNAMCTYAFNQL